MQYAISDAKAQLTSLVRKAEAGEDVVLTRHVVRLVAVKAKPSAEDRARAIVSAQASVAEMIEAGKVSRLPDAASSQDFLYDEDGLPKDSSI